MKQKLIKKNMFLFFLMAPLLLLAQDVVKGKVTDSSLGDPLPGVNVVIKGTTTGTTTDFDGNYELSVDNFPSILVFSSLGYASKEMQVSGPSTLNVALDESATGLRWSYWEIVPSQEQS